LEEFVLPGSFKEEEIERERRREEREVQRDGEVT
jgi:hypothetical protein